MIFCDLYLVIDIHSQLEMMDSDIFYSTIRPRPYTWVNYYISSLHSATHYNNNLHVDLYGINSYRPITISDLPCKTSSDIQSFLVFF